MPSSSGATFGHPAGSHHPLVAGTTERTATANRTYYPALDGLRAVAFLMVFFQHYDGLPWGWSGVNIFFVLSGFLITGILLDTRDRPRRASQFYLRRTLRIFPLYYGVFLFLLLTTPLFHWRWSPGWITWPLYLGNFARFWGHGGLSAAQQTLGDAQLHSARFAILVPYMGHFWSLCVEEQFYLVWPWVVFWTGSRRALLWICGAAVVLTPMARFYAEAHAPVWMLKEELLYRFTPFQLDALLLGGLLALLWRGGHRAALQRVATWVAGALGLVVAGYYAWIVGHYGLGFATRYSYPAGRLTWGLSFIDVFAAAVIVCALRPGSVVYRVLDRSPLRWLGRISYGAYVFHDIPHLPISGFVGHFGKRIAFLHVHQQALIILIALLWTLGAASLSYRYLETPFLNLKERWSGRVQGA